MMTSIRTLAVWSGLLMLAGCLSQEDGGSSQSSDSSADTGQNTAPKIWGSPASAVKTGDSYSFTPSANDADGDRITFTIANKPRWATFDSSVGRLSGQPQLGDIGTYSNIKITASDGTASTSLALFSVQVTESALGAMTLNWTPPTQNEDGSSLIDLAGYNIYYGETSGDYPNRIKVDNPSVSTYVVENLLPKTYYVVATAFNAAGIESGYSNEATMTVSAP